MTQDHKEDKVQSHFEYSSNLERVSELIQTRLVDCGWRDQVRLACRKTIVESNDHRIPTVDELIAIVTPKARSMVPDSVKKELLHELENIIINVDRNAHNKSS